jgi:hypothetical protein
MTSTAAAFRDGPVRSLSHAFNMNDQQGMIPPEDDEQGRELFHAEFELRTLEDDNADDSEALWNATGRG